MTKYIARGGKELIPELVGKKMCVLTDTGNGFKIKFPAHRSCDQNFYMSLDYSQAAYLLECLNQVENL